MSKSRQCDSVQISNFDLQRRSMTAETVLRAPLQSNQDTVDNAGALTVMAFQPKVREDYLAITGSTSQPGKPHDESNFSSSLAEGDRDALSGRFYPHRTSRDNRNHRDSGGIAFDGDHESPRQSARDHLSWQRQAALACLAVVRCGQQRPSALQPGRQRH